MYTINPATASDLRAQTRHASAPIPLTLWMDGRYFKTDPLKRVAGYETMVPAQWREKLYVKGDMDDLAEILPNVVAPQDNWLVQPLKPHPAALKTKDLVHEALKATRLADANPPPAIGADMFTFDEVRRQWNGDITDDEYIIWCHYQTGKMFSTLKVNDPSNGWNQYKRDLTDADFMAYFKRGMVGYDGHEWVPASLFYSGDVYEKIDSLLNGERGGVRNRQLIVNMLGEDGYNSQIDRLRAAAPKMLRLSDTKSERLALKVFDPFIHKFKVTSLATGRTFDDAIGLRSGYYHWIKELPKSKFKNGSNYSNIWDYYIHKESFPQDTPAPVKEETLRKAALDCNELWGEYLADIITSETQQYIEAVWNREYNRWSERPFLSIPLGFEMNKNFGTGPINPGEALWEGVRFLNAVGSGCVAYDVGVGKTMTAILAAAQAMYSGQCKRPVIIVPNPTYYKWIAETIGRYDENGKCIEQGVLPHFKGRVNDYYNLRGEYLQNMMQHPPQDYTITFLTFEALDEIGMSDAFQKTVGAELLDILDGSRNARDYQQMREDVERLMGEINANTSVMIDDLGFDYVVLDEAHNMKKLFTSVRSAAEADDNKDAGRYSMNSGKPTKRAMKMFMVSQYINNLTAGRNVVLLTATPFTNNPLEIFSMLVLVAYEKLKKNGVSNIRQFFDLFVNESSEYVINASNSIQLKAVVKGFDNRQILQQLVFGSMIHKTGEEAKVPRPIKVVYPRMKADGVTLPEDMQVDTALQPTDVQRHWMKEIAKLALNEKSAVEQFLGPSYYDTTSDNLFAASLLAVSLGRQCILSPYLLRAKRGGMETAATITDEGEGEDDGNSGEYIYFLGKPNPTALELFDSSPKLQYTLGCIKTIKAHHDKRNEPMGGVVIYLDGATDFHRPIMDYMADELGLKRNEVAVINGKTSKDQKESTKKRFLEGKVKVLMGSSTIKEGIDLQIKSTTLFNLTLPWNPTDLQQLEGRIWRQKNEHSHVRIVTPLIEDSVDIFLFQKLDEKTARINTIWYRAGRINVLNVDDFNPEELKFALMTDPEQRAKMEIEQTTVKIDNQRAVLEENITSLTDAHETIRIFNEIQSQIEHWYKEANAYCQGQLSLVRARLKVNEYTRKDALESDERKESRISGMLDAAQDADNQPKATYAIIKYHVNNYVDGDEMMAFSERKDEVDRQIKRADQLTRLQKNVLNPYNVTVTDDLTLILADLQKELEVVMAEQIKLKSDDHKKAVIARLVKEREDSIARSRPVSHRIEQFTTHNHLLSCLREIHDCTLDEQVVRIKKGAVVPMTATAIGKVDAPDKAKKIKMMEMKAKAGAARARALDLDVVPQSMAA